MLIGRQYRAADRVDEARYCCMAAHLVRIRIAKALDLDRSSGGTWTVMEALHRCAMARVCAGDGAGAAEFLTEALLLAQAPRLRLALRRLPAAEGE